VVAIEHDNDLDMLAALMVTEPTSLPTLAELVRRPPWMSDAACSGAGPSSWFPGRGEPTEPAKAVCRGCLVRARCLQYALDLPTITARGAVRHRGNDSTPAVAASTPER
jgi:Transcription factor WhiB